MGIKRHIAKFSDNQHTKNINISKRVRQGCILSPLLFNINVEKIFQLALENNPRGLKVNGDVINITVTSCEVERRNEQL